MVDTARQAVAESLSQFLHRRGAKVISPLPLHPLAHLRFDCPSMYASGLTAELGKMGFKVRFAGEADQPSYRGLVATAVFEIDLPRDAASTIDNGNYGSGNNIPGEIATAEDVAESKRYVAGGDPMQGM